jgi:hypothetical protein
LETVGTPLHAEQVEPDKLVWALVALAEGLGIRAVARVFVVAPNPVWRWLVAAAEPLEGVSRSFLPDMSVNQVQMDDLFAFLRAGKEGEGPEAIQRLSRSPSWV